MAPLFGSVSVSSAFRDRRGAANASSCSRVSGAARRMRASAPSASSRSSATRYGTPVSVETPLEHGAAAIGEQIALPRRATRTGAQLRDAIRIGPGEHRAGIGVVAPDRAWPLAPSRRASSRTRASAPGSVPRAAPRSAFEPRAQVRIARRAQQVALGEQARPAARPAVRAACRARAPACAPGADAARVASMARPVAVMPNCRVDGLEPHAAGRAPAPASAAGGASIHGSMHWRRAHPTAPVPAPAAPDPRSGSPAASARRAMPCAPSPHSRQALPGAVRPARPARCAAEACEMRTVTSRSMPVPGSNSERRARPGVDHHAHAFDGEAGLGDVGGEDQLAPAGRRGVRAPGAAHRGSSRRTAHARPARHTRTLLQRCAQAMDLRCSRAGTSAHRRRVCSSTRRTCAASASMVARAPACAARAARAAPCPR